MSASKSKPRAMTEQEIAGLNEEFEAMERSVRGYVEERLAGLGPSKSDRKRPDQAVAVARGGSSVAVPWVLGLAMVLIGLLIWRVVVLEGKVARLEAWAPAPPAAAGAGTSGPTTDSPVASGGSGGGPTLPPLSTFVAANRPALAAMLKDLVAGKGIAPGLVEQATADKLDALAGMLTQGDPLAAKDLKSIRDGLFEYQAHLAWQKAEVTPPASTSIDGDIGIEEYPLASLTSLWADLDLPAPDVLDATARQRVVGAAVLAG